MISQSTAINLLFLIEIWNLKDISLDGMWLINAELVITRDSNEYNFYFDSFTKECPVILSSLNLTQTKIFLTLIERWIDRPSQ